ncbi:MAG: hypothetical protein IJC11_03160 [Alphaproteobacteria bacterium]|nr:hypothetical protein [Alphaproteobacteria bacterium]
MAKQDNRKHFEISSGSIPPPAFGINVAKQSFVRQPIQEVMHSEDGTTITSKEFDENLIKLRTAIAQAESLLVGDSPSVENVNKAQQCLSNALAVNLPWSVKDREIRASHSETVRQLYKTVRESSGMGGTSSIGTQSEIMQRQGVALAQVINSDIRQQAILRDFQTMDTKAVYEKYWGNEVKQELAEIEHTNQMVQQISDMPDDTPEQRAEKDRRWKSLAEQEKQKVQVRQEKSKRRFAEINALYPKLPVERQECLSQKVNQDVVSKIKHNSSNMPSQEQRNLYSGANDMAKLSVTEVASDVGRFLTSHVKKLPETLDCVQQYVQSLSLPDQDVFNKQVLKSAEESLPRYQGETLEAYTIRLQSVIQGGKDFINPSCMKQIYSSVVKVYEYEVKKEYNGDAQRINDQVNKFVSDVSIVLGSNASSGSLPLISSNNLDFGETLGKSKKVTVATSKPKNVVNVSNGMVETIDNASNLLNSQSQSVVLKSNVSLSDKTTISSLLGACGQPVVSSTDSRLFALKNNQISSEK